MLSLQSEVAESVAREIAIQLTPDEARHLTGRATVNAEAHHEVVKCKHSMFAAPREAMDLAVRHARRALEIDPDYALAWSALAAALSALAFLTIRLSASNRPGEYPWICVTGGAIAAVHACLGDVDDAYRGSVSRWPRRRQA